MRVHVYKYICEWRRRLTLGEGCFSSSLSRFYWLRFITLKLESNYNLNTSFNATLHCDSLTNQRMLTVVFSVVFLSLLCASLCRAIAALPRLIKTSVLIMSAAACILASGLVALSCYTLIQYYAPLVPSPTAAWQLLFSTIRDDLSMVATLYPPLSYITELTNATHVLLSFVKEHTNLTSGISLAIAILVYIVVPSLSHAVLSCASFVTGAASAVN